MKSGEKSPSATDRAKILIVDDHPITRHGLEQLIKAERDLCVCGQAEDASQAFELLRTAKPDLVLADVTMPGKSGLEFVKDMHAAHPKLPVLMLSMHDESVFAERIIRAGGRGYVMKSAGGGELLNAIRRVLRGEVYLSKEMSTRLLSVFTGQRARPQRRNLAQLTDREFEIFQLLGQGLSSREIGQRLHVSSKTVDTHRLNIKEKLGFRSLPELMKHAVRWAAAQELI